MDHRTIRINTEQHNVSLLGFGAMRLPHLPSGDIDVAASEQLIDSALQRGVNYIDTAWTYDDGQSERVVGEILRKHDRNSFYLADKLPKDDCRTRADVTRIFNEQLRRCGVEYFDFYLIHQLNKEWFERVKKLDVVPQLMELQQQGKIKNLGFSFHDDYETFVRCVDYHDWDFVQIQLNYMDIDHQQGLRGYDYVTAKGIPVIVMEPIKGGSLVHINDDAARLMTERHPDRSLASWALRWVGSLDNVRVMLSGMSTIEQLEDNLATCTNFKPLKDDEQRIIAQVRTRLRQSIRVACTQCKYCMPCPQGVHIPINFREVNEFNMYHNRQHMAYAARRLGELGMRADRCVECMECVAKCPQQIDIPGELATFTAFLTTEGFIK